MYKYFSSRINKSALYWTQVCQLLCYSSKNPIARKSPNSFVRVVLLCIKARLPSSHPLTNFVQFAHDKMASRPNGLAPIQKKSGPLYWCWTKQKASSDEQMDKTTFRTKASSSVASMSSSVTMRWKTSLWREFRTVDTVDTTLQSVWCQCWKLFPLRHWRRSRIS